MPRPRAATICAQPGCPHDQPCPDHPPKAPWAGSTRGKASDPKWKRTRQRIITRDNGVCQHCGTPTATRVRGQWMGADVDHIVPEAEGGTDEDTNLQTLCAPCHTAKTAVDAARGRARNR